MEQDKQVTLNEAVRIRERSKAEGACVVFTNGCFDLLHDGHVACLSAARALGDVLIVGLNSDDSVCRVKGPDRPMNALTHRLADLSALRAVDYIVVFEEDTPEALLRAIQPDLLVKGADYKRDEIVGREIVEFFGGRVQTVAYLPGHSTTEKIASQS